MSDNQLMIALGIINLLMTAICIVFAILAHNLFRKIEVCVQRAEKCSNCMALSTAKIEKIDKSQHDFWEKVTGESPQMGVYQ